MEAFAPAGSFMETSMKVICSVSCLMVHEVEMMINLGRVIARLKSL